MPERPLLLFQEPQISNRDSEKGRNIKNHFHYPTFNTQKDRLSPQFESMKNCFVSDSTEGIEPEYVLVLETVGRIEDFERAVRAIEGLEWLAELETDEIVADNDYYGTPKINKTLFSSKIPALERNQSKILWEQLKKYEFIDKEGWLLRGDIENFKFYISDTFSAYVDDLIKIINEAVSEYKSQKLSGRLFLSMSNQRAMDELLRLWNGWTEKIELFKRPYGKWKEIFKYLKTIRRWDVRDRIRETGVEKYWQEDIELKRGTASKISFEIELWYRRDEAKRIEIQDEIVNLIKAENGSVLAICQMDEIRFLAIKAELPPESIEKALSRQYTRLFRNNNIMFFRPRGQWSVEIVPQGEQGEFQSGNTSGEPIIALLDGYPYANHSLLQNRLIIDDPDDYESSYSAGERHHGTAMASLICHGELDAEEKPLARPVYCRPIMKPNPHLRHEEVPDEIFIEDIIERSVRRIFEGEGNEPPVAPTIKIINLSIGDSTKMFFNQLSSTAKLLDWLSYKYQVLFCVSAGNITEEIDLKKQETEIKTFSDDELFKLTVERINANIWNRRLFSPADSINTVTVGALHADRSTPSDIGNRIDILPDQGFPSPISAIGFGFRNSIKPEIYFPGGRQLFEVVKGSTAFFLSQAISAPGQKVASVSRNPGEIDRYLYTRGTSNAAALASRSAGRIFETLEELNEKYNYRLPNENIAAIIKALLVHGASWGRNREMLEKYLPDIAGNTSMKKRITRYLGFGEPDINRVIECTANRATVIGYGVIRKNEKHVFLFPLPPCINDLREMRRLIITLAWFSPINPDSRKFRKALLSFETTDGVSTCGIKRKEADWQQVLNGTVQHEILEGKKRIKKLKDGDNLAIPIICKEDAGKLDDEVYYGLAVTLEVSEKIDIPLYEEIRERIRIPIRISD